MQIAYSCHLLYWITGIWQSAQLGERQTEDPKVPGSNSEDSREFWIIPGLGTVRFLEENTFLQSFYLLFARNVKINTLIAHLTKKISPREISQDWSAWKASNTRSKDRCLLIVVFLELSNVISASKVWGEGGGYKCATDPNNHQGVRNRTYALSLHYKVQL